MKRLAAVLLGALFLAGCSWRQPVSGPHLEFWTLSLKPTYTAYVEDMRHRYEAAHAPLTVEWLDLPERVLMQKLLACVAGGGSPPDLVNLGTGEAMRLAENNALWCVDDLVSPAERNRYFPDLWKSVQMGGKSYAIPWYVSVRLLMYNKAIFRQAGLDPQHAPTTWDEIESYSRVIHTKTPYYGLLPSIRMLDDWQQDGLPILDASHQHAAFDTAAHAARLAWYARLCRDDVIPAETLTGKYPEAVRRYKAGALGMLISGPQFLLSIRQDAPDVYANTGVAPLMKGLAGIVPAAVMCFVIPRASPHAAEAARLGLYLTNEANQLDFCKLVPLLPSTVATARDPFFLHGKREHPLEDEAIRISIQQLPYARDLNPYLPHGDKLGSKLEDAVEKVLYAARETRRSDAELAQDALQALHVAATRWNEILQEP